MTLTLIDEKSTECCIQCGNKKIISKKLCASCYMKQWLKDNPEKHKIKKQIGRSKAKELKLRYWEKHPEKKLESLEKLKTIKEYKICKVLKKHSKEMKDDPEHLTTEFMQKLIGIKCKHKRVINL